MEESSGAEDYNSNNNNNNTSPKTSPSKPNSSPVKRFYSHSWTSTATSPLKSSASPRLQIGRVDLGSSGGDGSKRILTKSQPLGSLGGSQVFGRIIDFGDLKLAPQFKPLYSRFYSDEIGTRPSNLRIKEVLSRLEDNVYKLIDFTESHPYEIISFLFPTFSLQEKSIGFALHPQARPLTEGEVDVIKSNSKIYLQAYNYFLNFFGWDLKPDTLEVVVRDDWRDRLELLNGEFTKFEAVIKRVLSSLNDLGFTTYRKNLITFLELNFSESNVDGRNFRIVSTIWIPPTEEWQT